MAVIEDIDRKMGYVTISLSASELVKLRNVFFLNVKAKDDNNKIQTVQETAEGNCKKGFYPLYADIILAANLLKGGTLGGDANKIAEFYMKDWED